MRVYFTITSPLLFSRAWTSGKFNNPLPPILEGHTLAETPVYHYSKLKLLFFVNLFILYTFVFKLVRLNNLLRLNLNPKPLNIFNVRVLRKRRFMKTVQRAPMAHRQWSQEQLGFSCSEITVSINLPDRVTVKPAAYLPNHVPSVRLGDGPSFKGIFSAVSGYSNSMFIVQRTSVYLKKFYFML